MCFPCSVRRRIYEGQVDTVKSERSERALPIPEALLTRLKGLSLEGWIFQATNGEPLNPKNAMNRHVLPAAKAVGIPTLNWHSFRHSFTVSQRQQGTHPKVVSALLGHSRVQLAMDVYDHVNVEEFRQPLGQMLRSVMKPESAAEGALIPKGMVGPPGFEPGTNGL
jgi:integrase